ncbi:MAG: tail fiber protein [Actinomycetia bacterium]|nr:tail fiber protein [Actinomycetes bacterium]
MADDRALDDPASAIRKLRADLEDARATLLARVQRGAVGDIEATLRSSPRAGQLFLQGQTVTRTTYADLWAWIVEQGLSPSVFGAGDGSTTFTLPDYRGRVLRGIGVGGAVGELLGADTPTLTTGQLPAHTHGSAGSHDHGGTNSAGSHGGHSSGVANVVPPGSGVNLPSFYDASDGSHTHSINTDGGHTHASVGSGDPLDVRQASFGGHWAIWT